jgi:hypothetical protein
VPYRFGLIAWLLLSAIISTGCSRGKESVDEGAATGIAPTGNRAVVSRVQAAARALAEPDPTVNYVAAQLEGVIKARTNSQALLHYDGYRVTFTTPGDRVTKITFDLTDAKPTIRQLTDVFGKPEELGRGMLYRYSTEATGATIRILAEPVSKPASETSLVRRILLEGEKIR